MSAADRAAMAAMAANLRGGRPLGDPTRALTRFGAPPPSVVPHSMPTTGLTRSENVAPSCAARAEKPATVVITSAPTWDSPSTTSTRLTPAPASAPVSAPIPAPALTERNTNVETSFPIINMGQVLKGTPDALAEAKSFLNSASTGHTRPSRSRIISGRSSTSSRSSLPSSSRAVRGTVAQDLLTTSSANRFPAYSPPVTRPAAHPSPSAAPNARDSFGSSQSGASVTADKPATSSDWNNFAVTYSSPSPTSTAVSTSAKPLAPTQAPPQVQAWGSVAKLHNRPTVTSTTTSAATKPAAPAAATSPLQVSGPGPAKAVDEAINGITASLGRAFLKNDDTANPMSSDKKDKVNGLLIRQMQSITNAVRSNTSDIPPHLRKTTAATSKQAPSIELVTSPPAVITETVKPIAAAPPKLSVADFNAPFKPTFSFSLPKPPAEKEEKVDVKSQTPAFTAPPAVKQEKPAFTPTTPTFQVKPASEQSLRATSAAVADGSKGNPFVIPADEEEEKGAEKKRDGKEDGMGAEMMKKMTELHSQVINLSARFTVEQAKTAALTQRVEELLKREERRLGLGTDTKKTPFIVEVTYPNRETKPIQATQLLKIADLIRRAAMDANISLQGTEPRIKFRGEQIGHSMLIGDTEIRQEPKVEFSY